MSLPSTIRIVEVGPRDGLQNEPTILSTATKIAFIEKLAASGLRYIEATSFVSPRAIPQTADHAELMRDIPRRPGVTYAALTPNLQGYQTAMTCKTQEVAVFTAASETFCQKNIHCSISESLERFKPVLEQAKQDQIKVRGYISCVLGCPYEGEVTVASVVKLAKQLLAMGCYEISLGDTIGVGTPSKAHALFEAVTKVVPASALAAHFHDTYGQALANLYAVLPLGIATIDSSVAGLGGCPYAKGASGNVATEDVVYMLQGLGIDTGINLDRLVEAGYFISHLLNHEPRSRVGLAYKTKRTMTSKI